MDYTMLVNNENPLDKDYVPQNLVEYKIYNGPKIDPNYKTMVNKKCLKAFNKLNKKAQKNGYFFIIDSAYRSYDYQVKIYQDYLNKNGQKTYNTVAKPGTSEHQSGLAIDIALQKDGQYTDKFKDTDEEIVFFKNIAYKYGFILRYPKDKILITNMAYEYWHYRYVGKKAAKVMNKYNLCLEEYKSGRLN